MPSGCTGGTGTFKEAWQDLIYRGELFEKVFDEAIQPILRTQPCPPTPSASGDGRRAAKHYLNA